MITIIRAVRTILYVPFQFVAWLTCLIDAPLRWYLLSHRDDD